VVREVITERQLWRKLKNESKRIAWTRLENWALFGTPDLLGYAPSGNFFTLELKVTPQKNPIFCGSPRTKYHSTLSIKKILMCL